VEQGEEAPFLHPGTRYEDSFVEGSKAGPLTDEVRGDFREVATEKRLSQGDGFKKGEAKPFGDRGRNQMGGLGQPTGVGGVRAPGGR